MDYDQAVIIIVGLSSMVAFFILVTESNKMINEYLEDNTINPKNTNSQ